MEGERRRVNEWKEANVGGSKGRHSAGPYIDFDLEFNLILKGLRLSSGLTATG